LSGRGHREADVLAKRSCRLASNARATGVAFETLGKFCLTHHKDNDYLIDREAQRKESFTGIAGIHQQDQAVTESMGRSRTARKSISVVRMPW